MACFNKDSVKLKGLRTGVTGFLWKAIKREKDEDVLAIEFNEFKASRVCFRCYSDLLNKVESVKDHSVLECSNCKTLWQKDINAAKNMSLIASYIWNDYNRPPMSQRPTTTT